MENVPYTLFYVYGTLFYFAFRLLFGSKIIFADSAVRAAPIIGKLLESGSGLNSVGGIALGGVIDVTTNAANVLFHFLFSFLDGYKIFLFTLFDQHLCQTSAGVAGCGKFFGSRHIFDLNKLFGLFDTHGIEFS